MIFNKKSFASGFIEGHVKYYSQFLVISVFNLKLFNIESNIWLNYLYFAQFNLLATNANRAEIAVSARLALLRRKIVKFNPS